MPKTTLNLYQNQSIYRLYEHETQLQPPTIFILFVMRSKNCNEANLKSKYPKGKLNTYVRNKDNTIFGACRFLSYPFLFICFFIVLHSLWHQIHTLRPTHFDFFQHKIVKEDLSNEEKKLKNIRIILSRGRKSK